MPPSMRVVILALDDSRQGLGEERAETRMGMLVYGDPQHQLPLHDALAEVRILADRLASMTHPPMDELRVLLIRVGQLEQALMDGLPEGSPTLTGELRAVQQATDLAASAFHSRWVHGHGAASHLINERGGLEALRRVLRELCRLPNNPVCLKAPEGYAFYALYPEQYCQAALDWIADHPDAKPGPVLVVGVRSIGTSLSAVVSSVLKTAGYTPTRLTIRPTGHPFDRRVSLSGSELGGARYALVVDEGPGQSGSSLASVAEALQAVGVPPERISFFPGHAGLPGPAASERTRWWWAVVRRYSVPATAPLWEGRNLTDELARTTADWLGTGATELEDLAAGNWRHFAFSARRDWPVVCPPFERPQYRAVAADGRAVRWKFVGLEEAEAIFRLLQARAAGGWTLFPLGHTLGFVAQPWVEGTPLTPEDATPEVMFHVGRYVAAVAGPSLSRDAQTSALTRLREMAVWNTREVAGVAPAEQIERWGEAALEYINPIREARYGDGRMAPHGWWRLPSGHVVKADAFDHTLDHTLVGEQSVLWDLAGALVEWRPKTETARALLEGFRVDGGGCVSAPAIMFHYLAYAAFRLGQCAMCADLVDDREERRRLHRAMDRYTQTVRLLLSGDPDHAFGLHLGSGSGPSV